MENNEILAIKEDFDAIYRDFSKDLGEYLRNMQDNVSKITDAVSALRQSWVSSNFDKFERHVTNGMADVTDGLSVCRKLKEQMDLLEQELSEDIKFLKSEYKD